MPNDKLLADLQDVEAELEAPELTVPPSQVTYGAYTPPAQQPQTFGAYTPPAPNLADDLLRVEAELTEQDRRKVQRALPKILTEASAKAGRAAALGMRKQYPEAYSDPAAFADLLDAQIEAARSRAALSQRPGLQPEDPGFFRGAGTTTVTGLNDFVGLMAVPIPGVSSKNIFARSQQLRQDTTPTDASIETQAGQLFGSILPSLVPGAAGGAAVGKLAATLGAGVVGQRVAALAGAALASGYQSAVPKYHEMRAEGYGVPASVGAALTSGAITGAVTAKFGLRGALNVLNPPTRLAMRAAIAEIVKHAGIEGIEEMTEQVFQATLDKLTTPGMTFEDALREVGTAGLAGFLGGGAVNLPHALHPVQARIEAGRHERNAQAQIALRERNAQAHAALQEFDPANAQRVIPPTLDLDPSHVEAPPVTTEELNAIDAELNRRGDQPSDESSAYWADQADLRGQQAEDAAFDAEERAAIQGEGEGTALAQTLQRPPAPAAKVPRQAEADFYTKTPEPETPPSAPAPTVKIPRQTETDFSTKTPEPETEPHRPAYEQQETIPLTEEDTSFDFGANEPETKPEPAPAAVAVAEPAPAPKPVAKPAPAPQAPRAKPAPAPAPATATATATASEADAERPSARHQRYVREGYRPTKAALEAQLAVATKPDDKARLSQRLRDLEKRHAAIERFGPLPETLPAEWIIGADGRYTNLPRPNPFITRQDIIDRMPEADRAEYAAINAKNIPDLKTRLEARQAWEAKRGITDHVYVGSVVGAKTERNQSGVVEFKEDALKKLNAVADRWPVTAKPAAVQVAQPELSPATKAALASAPKKPKPRRPSRITRRRDGSADILNDIAEGNRIYLPPRGKRGGEFDGMPVIPGAFTDIFSTSPGAERVDSVAGQQGLTVTELWKRIENAIKARKNPRLYAEPTEAELAAAERRDQEDAARRPKPETPPADDAGEGEVIPFLSVHPTRMTAAEVDSVQDVPEGELAVEHRAARDFFASVGVPARVVRGLPKDKIWAVFQKKRGTHSVLISDTAPVSQITHIIGHEASHAALAKLPAEERARVLEAFRRALGPTRYRAMIAAIKEGWDTEHFTEHDVLEEIFAEHGGDVYAHDSVFMARLTGDHPGIVTKIIEGIRDAARRIGLFGRGAKLQQMVRDLHVRAFALQVEQEMVENTGLVSERYMASFMPRDKDPAVRYQQSIFGEDTPTPDTVLTPELNGPVTPTAGQAVQENLFGPGEAIDTTKRATKRAPPTRQTTLDFDNAATNDIKFMTAQLTEDIEPDAPVPGDLGSRTKTFVDRLKKKLSLKGELRAVFNVKHFIESKLVTLETMAHRYPMGRGAYRNIRDALAQVSRLNTEGSELADPIVHGDRADVAAVENLLRQAEENDAAPDLSKLTDAQRKLVDSLREVAAWGSRTSARALYEQFGEKLNATEDPFEAPLQRLEDEVDEAERQREILRSTIRSLKAAARKTDANQEAFENGNVLERIEAAQAELDQIDPQDLRRRKELASVLSEAKAVIDDAAANGAAGGGLLGRIGVISPELAILKTLKNRPRDVQEAILGVEGADLLPEQIGALYRQINAPGSKRSLKNAAAAYVTSTAQWATRTTLKAKMKVELDNMRGRNSSTAQAAIQELRDRRIVIAKKMRANQITQAEGTHLINTIDDQIKDFGSLKQYPELVKFWQTAVDYITSPPRFGEFPFMRRVGSFVQMALSPATAVANQTQNVLVGGPVAASVFGARGYGKVIATERLVPSLLGHALSDPLTEADIVEKVAAKVGGKLGAALLDARRDGYFASPEKQEFLDLSKTQTDTALRQAGRKVETAGWWMFHKSTQMVRTKAFITGFQLAETATDADWKAAELLGYSRERTPEAFARWYVDQVDFVSGPHNRPAFFRGPGTLLAAMKNYMINYQNLAHRLQLAHREGGGPRQAMARVVLHAQVALLGGALGATLGGAAAKALLELLMQHVTDDDRWNVSDWVASKLGKGTTLGTLADTALNGAAPGNWAQRVSPFGTAVPSDMDSLANWSAPIGAAVRVGRGAVGAIGAATQAVRYPDIPGNTGDFIRSLANLTQGTTQIYQGIQGLQTGGLQTRTGTPMVAPGQLTTWDALNLLIGSKTSHTTGLMRDTRVAQAFEKANDAPQNYLLDKYVDAFVASCEAGTPEARASASRGLIAVATAISEHNARAAAANRPQDYIIVTPGSLKQRIIQHYYGVGPSTIARQARPAFAQYLGDEGMDAYQEGVQKALAVDDE